MNPYCTTSFVNCSLQHEIITSHFQTLPKHLDVRGANGSETVPCILPRPPADRKQQPPTRDRQHPTRDRQHRDRGREQTRCFTVSLPRSEQYR